MAPGTEAGAAHVVFEMGKPDATEEEKVENDAEAFLRSYVTRRGRNTDAAVAAVKLSHSYTAEEALNQHLIDLVANNDTDLLNALNGREITRIDGIEDDASSGRCAHRGCYGPHCAMNCWAGSSIPISRCSSSWAGRC